MTTVPAAGLITEDGTIPGLFHITGFSTFGRRVWSLSTSGAAGRASVVAVTLSPDLSLAVSAVFSAGLGSSTFGGCSAFASNFASSGFAPSAACASAITELLLASAETAG